MADARAETSASVEQVPDRRQGLWAPRSALYERRRSQVFRREAAVSSSRIVRGQLPADPALDGAPFSTRDRHHRPRALHERISVLSLALAGVDAIAYLVLALLGQHSPVVVPLLISVATVRPAMRLYRTRLRVSWMEDLPRSLGSWVICGAVAIAVSAVFDPAETAQVRRVLVLVLGVVTAAEVARVACMAAVRHARRRYGLGQRTLIMGAGTVGRALAQAMSAHPELGLKPVGFLDPEPTAAPLSIPLVAESSSELAAVIERERIGVVVVSFALTREAELVDTVITAHQMECAVLVVPRLFELHHDGPDVERVRGYPLVRLRPDPTSRLSWWVKRACDVVAAGLALVVVSPILVVAALATLIESGRPVLFHQTRIGLDGVPFKLHKLRSLRPESELEAQTTWSIATDDRVGRVGRLLRRRSVDELPQLWNIIRGEMSFVGPRPERPGYVEVFSIEHERYWARHRVPAGLTGLSQVNGLRGDTSIEDRARYDNYYIANWSLWLDLRIMVLTAREVVRGTGG